MTLSELSPFVRQATMSKMSLDRCISYKLRTRDHRLFYILGGEGNIVVEGVSYPLEAGTVVLFRSGTEYMWQLGEVRYLAVNFDYTSAHSHLRRSFHVERSESVDSVLESDVAFSDAEVLNSPIILRGAASLEGSFTEIVNEFSMKGEWCDEYVSSLLYSLIITIARRASAPSELRRPAVCEDIISYVSANYNRPIRNTDIAAHLHLNPTYMNRVFRRPTGMTVRAYLIDYRINAAIELLSVGEIGISELAAAVGFSDLPHFIKTFKAHTGKTPGEYRRA